MRVLIGSRAIKHWFPDFPREPKDTDFAWDEGGISIVREEWGTYEYYPIPPLMSLGVSTLTPDQIYTLKVSHLFWDIKWEKTMWDVTWLRKKGCNLDRTLFEELYWHWESVHGVAKRADLNMMADAFFDNAIPDGHDHDLLHTLIKNPPTYTKILANPEEPGAVAIDEQKFWDLETEDKYNVIREECYVMAYERMGDSDYRDAYLKQLKAWILHHGPSVNMGLFAIHNYDVLRKPLINYKEVIDYGKQGKANV